MPRVTISINAANTQLEHDLITLDLPPGLTVADLKAFVEAETSISTQSQHFYLNGQPLNPDSQTLEAAGIKDGEMLAMVVNAPSSQTSSQRIPAQAAVPQQQQSSGRAAADDGKIEATRQRIVQDPAAMAQLRQSQPQLAEAVNDPARFRQLWNSIRQQEEQAALERQREIALLNEDPFNPEAQKKIADIIRRERIEQNRQYAYENNPEVFVQVTMLYVDIKVNGHPIKAFVDSGAQSTIMSPSCAEACHIDHLIDERYAGIARGVGTAKILGRVHAAKIEIGDAELDCSFTVMEGRDVDLLFGLDMLRRHQACIDLVNNELRFPHTTVKFLGESDIPKRWEERLMDEPVVQGPDGMEIGAKTGTVRPAGSAAQAAKDLKEEGSGKGKESATASASSNPSQPTASASTLSAPRTVVQNPPIPISTVVPPSNPPQTQSQYPEQDIAQLQAIGFSRSDAIAALDACGGNVEFAASLLFSQLQ